MKRSLIAALLGTFLITEGAWAREGHLTISEAERVHVLLLMDTDADKRQSGQAKFRAWLKAVATSKINDHFRRQGKQPVAFGGTTVMQRFDELPDDGEADCPSNNSAVESDQGLVGSEESFVTNRTLEMVKGEFRKNTWMAFYRCAVDGRTSQEVAAELGISAVAVRKAKSRVMARLREALGEGDGDGSPPERPNDEGEPPA